MLQDVKPLEIIASICGWCYFFIWGSYMYPQAFLNHRLKNVEGFKLDYPFLNLTGYIFICICNVTAYFHTFPFGNYGLGTIKIQDVLYAINGTILCLVLNIQALKYPRGKNTIAPFSILFTCFAWISALVYFMFSEVTGSVPPSDKMNILLYLGDLKVVVNIIKYVPLIYFNFRRKTTEGMSIVAFSLNLTGATFSLLQLFLDFHNGTTKVLNPVKLSLGAVTIFYDIILIIQYMAYRGRIRDMEQSSLSTYVSPDQEAQEKERLLP